MTNYLLLDGENKAINYITANPGVVKIIEYEGIFFEGGLFDGETVLDPNFREDLDVQS